MYEFTRKDMLSSNSLCMYMFCLLACLCFQFSMAPCYFVVLCTVTRGFIKDSYFLRLFTKLRSSLFLVVIMFQMVVRWR